MIDLLFLWHMHQPRYLHPGTGRAALPWVRLHACSGYLDMARVLQRHPEIRVTVNFVPVLVEQIEALLAGTRDELERLAEKPVAELDAAEQAYVVARSFSVADRAIAARPRFAELHARRKAQAFSPADLADLQCLFLLGWLGFAAREDDPRIDALDRKGRGYTEDDRAALLACVRQAVAGVLPAWRALAALGQVELTASPYHHPIVPLLLDTETAHRARPGDHLPPRFASPDDAREQVERGLAAHERTFGSRPAGMWPPEGSLSPEAVALYGEQGVRWLAADEQTLRRSLDGHAPSVGGRAAPARAEREHHVHPGTYLPGDHEGDAPLSSAPGLAPHTRLWRHAGVDLVFRDRDLSDRIGFRYSGMAATDAVKDLLDGVKARGGGAGVVGIFLDGENCWEAYPERGALFLEALHAALATEARAGRIRTRTVSEAVAGRGPGAELPRLHSGSWIDAAFHIWIGDPVKNRAWAALGRLRGRVAEVARERGADDPGVRRARDLALIAQASDWFWWFGEPNHSSEDALFDALFREHLQAGFRALGDEPPADLGRPIAG